MIEFNKKANVIYNDAGEKNVAAVVLYPNGSNVLCWDEAFEAPIMPTELADLCVKGLALVKVADKLNAITAFGVAASDDVAFAVTVGDKTYNSGTKAAE